MLRCKGEWENVKLIDEVEWTTCRFCITENRTCIQNPQLAQGAGTELSLVYILIRKQRENLSIGLGRLLSVRSLVIHINYRVYFLTQEGSVDGLLPVFQPSVWNMNEGEEVWQGICKMKTLLLGWWIAAWLISPPNFFVMSHYFFKRKNMLESSQPLPQAPRWTVSNTRASLCPSPSTRDGGGVAGPGHFLLHSSQPGPLIATLQSLLLCRACECLAELPSEGAFLILSNKPARLLGADKGKERVGLLNTCFAKSVLKKIASYLICWLCNAGWIAKLKVKEVWALGTLAMWTSIMFEWKILSFSFFK